MKYFSNVFKVVIIIAVSSFNLYANERVEVVNVHSGDELSIRYLDGDKKHHIEKVKLFGIAAPTLNQPYGMFAKKNLSFLTLSPNLTFQKRALTVGGQTEGDLYADGKSVNYQQVADGYAWQSKKFTTDTKMDRAFRDARIKKLGMWKDFREPVPPAEYNAKVNSKNYAKPKLNSYDPNLFICIVDKTNEILYLSVKKKICPKGSRPANEIKYKEYISDVIKDNNAIEEDKRLKTERRYYTE